MATIKIRAACLASADELAPHLPQTHTVGERSFILSLHPALALSPQLQNRIYSLFDSNMREVSKGTSMTYTERSKREEMFDEATRFLILRETSGSASGSSKSPEPAAGGASTSDNLVAEERTQNMPGSLPPPPAMQSTSSGSMRKRNGAHRRSQEERDMGLDIEPDELVGYCSFRFDTEETLSSRDAEVVYCYELQLDERARKLGMARRLMDEMEEIGRRRRLDKVMLTCLKGNTGALAFYGKQGYTADEIDPTRMDEEPDSDGEVGEVDGSSEGDDEEPVDYVILSKSLR